MLSLTLLSTFLLACSSTASPLEPRATKINLNIDFSTYKVGTPYDEFLSSVGLYRSSYKVNSTPLAHTFTASNVAITSGGLRLKVTGQSVPGSVKSAEVGTVVDNILYGKITTRAKAPSVAGVCSGWFFYKDDSQETDIELLSSYYTTGFGDAVSPGLELTNQAVKAGGKSTNAAVPYGFDPTATYHDYTIEWTSRFTKFYVDGKLVKYFTSNVPTEPSSFLWNSWSSGDPNWSAGPPRADAYTYISSISGYYFLG